MTEQKKSGNDHAQLVNEIEKIFSIRIRPHESKKIHTFGELTDLVIAKINLRDEQHSGQHGAFEKLKNAIASSQDIRKEEIQMQTKLADLFPRRFRRTAIRELQFEMGFDLRVLRPYLIIEALFILLLLGTIVTFFFNLIYGLEALALLILLINLAFRTGKEFNCETVGDLAAKILKDKNKGRIKNYPAFTNEEITAELKLIFGEMISHSGEITRETAF